MNDWPSASTWSMHLKSETRQLLCVFCGRWDWFTFQDSGRPAIGVCRGAECMCQVNAPLVFAEKSAIATEAITGRAGLPDVGFLF